MASRLSSHNYCLESGVVFTPSNPSATGYSEARLANSMRGRQWRGGTGTQSMVAALAAADTVSSIYLINSVPHVGGTVLAETKSGGGSYSNFGGGTGLFTYPASNRTKLVALYSTSGVTADHVRITFTDTAATGTRPEIGVLYVGHYLEPTQSVKPGPTIPPFDPSDIAYSAGGQKFSSKRANYQTPTATYSPLSATDRDALMQAFDLVGSNEPVVFTIDPTSVDLTWYGYLSISVGHNANSRDQWAIGVKLEEAR